jgi:phage N-6-adenine-methyltransferase
MPAKRIFKFEDFLAMLRTPLSTGEIARKICCNRGTALKYLKELKTKKHVLETRISNTINLWKLAGKRLPHVAQNGGNNEWYTPESYIKAATAVMGEIDLDPASALPANKVVGAKVFYTAEDDGLTKNWSGKIWLNPPYSSELISSFCDKLRVHFESGDVTESIVLVNNATETLWFNKLISIASAIMFPSTRVRFWSPDGRLSQPLQGRVCELLKTVCKRISLHFPQLLGMHSLFRN